MKAKAWNRISGSQPEASAVGTVDLVAVPLLEYLTDEDEDMEELDNSPEAAVTTVNERSEPEELLTPPGLTSTGRTGDLISYLARTAYRYRPHPNVEATDSRLPPRAGPGRFAISYA
ncbi:hypothetical protein RSAG8_04765, partial [Rhizoctonia solani AG-8 WAC10335]